MSGNGFSHVRLVTLDLDRTRAFYEGGPSAMTDFRHE